MKWLLLNKAGNATLYVYASPARLLTSLMWNQQCGLKFTPGECRCVNKLTQARWIQGHDPPGFSMYLWSLSRMRYLFLMVRRETEPALEMTRCLRRSNRVACPFNKPAKSHKPLAGTSQRCPPLLTATYRRYSIMTPIKALHPWSINVVSQPLMFNCESLKWPSQQHQTSHAPHQSAWILDRLPFFKWLCGGGWEMSTPVHRSDGGLFRRRIS